VIVADISGNVEPLEIPERLRLLKWQIAADCGCDRWRYYGIPLERKLLVCGIVKIKNGGRFPRFGWRYGTSDCFRLPDPLLHEIALTEIIELLAKRDEAKWNAAVAKIKKDSSKPKNPIMKSLLLWLLATIALLVFGLVAHAQPPDVRGWIVGVGLMLVNLGLMWRVCRK
jgi:hypothetical protein